jgi:hypothetical protein
MSMSASTARIVSYSSGSHDDLGAIRGIRNGLLMAAPFWLALWCAVHLFGG